MDSIASDTRIEEVTRNVRIEGVRPIMFDRYPGDNDTRLQWHEKVYLVPKTNVLALPVMNINSFYTATNTASATKVLRDKRKFKDLARAFQSYMTISGHGDNPEYLPFMRDNAPIEVGSFSETEDEKSRLFLHRAVARLDKGIPNPKERPVLPLPWSLEFSVQFTPNNAFKESEARDLLKAGGKAIGLGTYRPLFGKFQVTQWE